MHFRPKPMFSVTVFQGKSANCWNTTARSGPGCSTSLPPTRTLPAEGNSRPAAILIKVVLPQPEGPTMETNSLSPTSKLTSSSARKRSPPRLKVRCTRSKVI
ncbi:hypothetical protein D9M69_689010 [compost metagenome]